MVEMTELLMERKADYSQVHDKVSRTMVKDPIILNHKPLLNGDFEFLGRQHRSSSECSSDSNLDTLLEEADKIQSSKNGFRKNAPAKKQVRFNMERNKEYFYSYAQGSDDDISCDLINNVNFVDYKCNDNNTYENDDDDDDEEEEDDDDDDEDSEEDEEDEEDYSDHTDWESSEDDSRGDKFGYLVDKSTPPVEVNNNSSDSNIGVNSKKLNGTTDSVNGISDSVGEKIIVNGPIDHQDVQNGKLYEEKRLLDLRTQVLHLESSLRAKQDSVENEMSNLSSKLKKTREDTKQEMDKLQKELEDRKRHYITEMEDIDRRREEQKRKFEEELEEFRNEKKLEERRQRYYEHEAAISQMEKELNQRRQDVQERDKEIREYEEYLNRRHAVCNGKEEDLDVLQNELDTLAKELEAKKAKLLHKHQLVHQSSEEDMAVSTPPLRVRSSSRASVASKGVDLRIEELKSQNRQLLEELFTLKKACEGKDEELTELKEKLEVSENESKRLQQRTKHLETQLELARKSAELGSDSISVDEIMRKTTQDMRSARNSRVIRPSRAVAPSPSVSSSPGFKLPRISSNDSLGTKITSSSDSGKGTKESGMKGSKGSASKKNKDEGNGRHKLGTERITSSLCVIM